MINDLINWQILLFNKYYDFNYSYSYQIYYSQAAANVKRGSELKMVNWWSAIDGLVRFPLLPPPKRVYTNFEGRRFIVPVLHVCKTKNLYFFMVKYINALINIMYLGQCFSNCGSQANFLWVVRGKYLFKLYKLYRYYKVLWIPKITRKPPCYYNVNLTLIFQIFSIIYLL